MKSIKVDGKKYNVPTEWKDIKLSDYLFLLGQDKKDRFQSIEFVARVTGIDAELFKQAEKDFYYSVAGLMTFVDKEIPQDEKKTVIVNGKEMHYSGVVSSICLGQYVDIDFRLDEHKDKIDSAIPWVLAILYKEKDAKYNSNQSALLYEDFCKLPITDVFGMFSFFLPKLRNSKKDLELYLKVENLMLRTGQSLRHSVISGSGHK